VEFLFPVPGLPDLLPRALGPEHDPGPDSVLVIVLLKHGDILNRGKRLDITHYRCVEVKIKNIAFNIRSKQLHLGPPAGQSILKWRTIRDLQIGQAL